MELKELIQKKLKDNPEKAKRLNDLLEEKKRREIENLCEKYTPNLKCEEFIKIVGENKTFVNLFSAANGVGKTAVGANIVANICFGKQNEWFEHPLYKKFPYVKRGRIISDPTTIKKQIIPELKKWFPSNRYDVRYATEKEGKPYECKWTTDTGFEFDLMTTEQAAKEFESVTLGWVWIDEPCPQDIYLATIARMRTGGIIFWTMTPLAYSAWIKDEIYDKRDGVNIEYVEADVWANCKDIEGTRGILSKENIEKMISQYPEDEKEARINGKFGHLLGRVHKAFNRKTHVIKPFKIELEKYVVVKAHDTHPREPDHILWMAIDEKGTKFFIDELVISGTTAEMAAKIKMKEQVGEWRMLEDDLIDPSAFNTDERTSEISVADKLRDEGIVYRAGSKDLAGCIRRTDDALHYEERAGELVKAPEIYWFETVPVAIRQMEKYVWDEYRGKSADEKQPKGRPKDKDDHQVENAHRLLKEEYEFEKYIPETFEDEEEEEVLYPNIGV